MIKIGLASYSIYLWHQPIISFAKTISPEHQGSPWQGAVVGGLILIFGFASRRWVELPFMNKDLPESFYRRTIIVCAMASLSLYFLTTPIGEIQRKKMASQFVAAKTIEDRLRTNYGLDVNCRIIENFDENKCSTKETPTALLWGDSHAMHLSEMLIEMDIGYYQRTKSACAPTPDYLPPKPTKKEKDCFLHSNEVLEWLDSKEDIDTIVLSSYNWWGYKIKNNLEEQDILTTHMERFLEQLIKDGKKIIIIGNSPASTKNTAKCIQNNLWLGKKEANCNYTSPKTTAQTYVNSLLEKLGSIKGVFYIPIIPTLCPNETCEAMKDNIIIFRDAHHLSYEGSKYLGSLLKKQNGIKKLLKE
jgi:hypothetical protein